MKPELSIGSITFKDNTTLTLEKDSIVVLVGPNNCGKSEVLNEIKQLLINPQYDSKIVKELTINKTGDSVNLIEWMKNNIYHTVDRNDSKRFHRDGFQCHESQATSAWNSTNNQLRDLTELLVQHVTTTNRLNIVAPADIINMRDDIPQNPIHHLYRSKSLENKISKYCKKAFSDGIVVHRHSGSIIPMYFGKKPVLDESENTDDESYVIKIENLRRLEKQGDGIKSFIAVLLKIYCEQYYISLIDEPDAFLHPPQAEIIGQILGDKNGPKQQYFFATHSSSFLKGLLDTDNNKINILRITRTNDNNKISVLENSLIKKLWNDPIFRYSDILDGLFNDLSIVCESDSDCRFYNAISNTLIAQHPRKKKKTIKYISSSGKDRQHVIIQALKQLDVQVKSITDFDVLNEENTIKKIYESLNGNWANIRDLWNNLKNVIESIKPPLSAKEICTEIQIILKTINGSQFPNDKKREISNLLKLNTHWALAKKVGKGCIPSGDPTNDFENLDKKLQKVGFYIVGSGELESFYKKIGKHGPKWVNKVLDDVDLARDPDLEDARKFMYKIIF